MHDLQDSYIFLWSNPSKKEKLYTVMLFWLPLKTETDVFIQKLKGKRYRGILDVINDFLE